MLSNEERAKIEAMSAAELVDFLEAEGWSPTARPTPGVKPYPYELDTFADRPPRAQQALSAWREVDPDRSVGFLQHLVSEGRLTD